MPLALLVRISIAVMIVFAAVALPACGGGDDEPEGPCVNEFTADPVDCSNESAISASEAETTTSDTTEDATTEDTTTTTTATDELPIEELVAFAAGVTPEEVGCGDEDLEAAVGGGGTCEADGTEYVVAGLGEDLELDTLTARLAGIETAKKVSGSYLKPRAAKNGIFVVGNLSVTNEQGKPDRFDDFGEQVQLKAGQATYNEPFNVLNGVLTDSFLWKGKKIQPGQSQVGKVAFDVPELAVDAIETEGSLVVLNFGDEGNARRADQVGLIRTAE
jgi:hypothetical protein